MTSQSDPCSAGSEVLTSASSGPVCELCGSASRTRSASGSLPGTGPASLSTVTCAPWWPTPDAGVFNLTETAEGWLARNREIAKRYGRENFRPPLAVAVKVGEWCPCRCHTSTSSAAASPAKTSATPAKEQGSTVNARVFGRSTPDSFANYDPATCSWRTSQLSLLEDSGEFSETWPRAGMTRNGTAFRLVPLAPLTAATGSGLLPTPSATMADRGGRGDLIQVVRGNPSPSGHFKMWPTPTTQDAANDGGPSQFERNSLPLNALVKGETGGQLNPTWVEWLMGFPPGWTDCGPSETRSSRRSRNGSDTASSNGRD
jgi:hypothetical protein